MRMGRKRREKGRGGKEEGRERGGWEGRERERKKREGGRGGKDGGGREIHMKIIANNFSKRDWTEARRKCSRTDLNFPKASLI